MIVPTIHDPDGRARTWDWLLETFGDVLFLPAEAEPAQDAYRIVRLCADFSRGQLSAAVLQPDGRPQSGACVVRHWPGAPPLRLAGEPPSPAGSPLAPERGVAARTRADGLATFPVGAEDVYALPNAGESTLYVRDPQAPSDLIGGLGVLHAEGVQLCLHVTWQRIRGGGEAWCPEARPVPSLARLATGQAVILDLLARIAQHLGLEV